MKYQRQGGRKMKKKETIFIIAFLMIATILIGGYLVYKNIINKPNEEITEYTPQEEISDSQLRQTIITLYYKNTQSGEIMPEARQVDVNVLAKSPYEYLVNCLIEKPKSEKLSTVIPDGTKLNKIELKGDILYIDFSKEFTQNTKGEEQSKIIESIVKTVTELKEVDGIRILIEGEENKEFEGKGMSFKENFYRED